VPPTAHPLTVGLPPHEPEVAELIGRADVLLAVGGDLDGMNTRNWTMPRPPRLVALDPAPLPDPPEWAPDATVTGRLGDALRGLRDRLPSRAPWAPSSLGEQARERIAADPVSAEAMALVAAVEAARTDETVLVCDMAVAGYWVGGYASAPGPRRLAYPVGWGTLGFGLPAAIGPAAAGHPVIAVCGDGGLALGVGELATLVQERLPVTVLVVDDGGYGMLRFDQAQSGVEPFGVDLDTPDFVALAGAFGVRASAVEGIGEDFAVALGEHLADPAPSLLVARAALTPPPTTSPRWYREGPPAWADPLGGLG
jgi:acetolactate synthase-1/2/3 large subunit